MNTELSIATETDTWISPTHGIVRLDKMIEIINDYVNPKSKENIDVHRYLIVVGTDSQKHDNRHKFSTSVIVRKMIDDIHGKGGIFFVKNEYYTNIYSIKQKIITEAGITLMTASAIYEALEDTIDYLMSQNIDVDFELHFDVSENGASKVALKDVKSMALSSGFNFSIKPHGWGASSVSNKYSK